MNKEESLGEISSCADPKILWLDCEPDGECPECGRLTLQGEAMTSCWYSPADCNKCGAQPCDGSC